jgi:hypothetical protein
MSGLLAAASATSAVDLPELGELAFHVALLQERRRLKRRGAKRGQWIAQISPHRIASSVQSVLADVMLQSQALARQTPDSNPVDCARALLILDCRRLSRRAGRPKKGRRPLMWAAQERAWAHRMLGVQYGLFARRRGIRTLRGTICHLERQPGDLSEVSAEEVVREIDRSLSDREVRTIAKRMRDALVRYDVEPPRL